MVFKLLASRSPRAIVSILISAYHHDSFSILPPQMIILPFTQFQFTSYIDQSPLGFIMSFGIANNSSDVCYTYSIESYIEQGLAFFNHPHIKCLCTVNILQKIVQSCLSCISSFIHLDFVICMYEVVPWRYLELDESPFILYCTTKYRPIQHPSAKDLSKRHICKDDLKLVRNWRL